MGCRSIRCHHTNNHLTATEWRCFPCQPFEGGEVGHFIRIHHRISLLSLSLSLSLSQSLLSFPEGVPSALSVPHSVYNASGHVDTVGRCPQHHVCDLGHNTRQDDMSPLWGCLSLFSTQPSDVLRRAKRKIIPSLSVIPTPYIDGCVPHPMNEYHGVDDWQEQQRHYDGYSCPQGRWKPDPLHDTVDYRERSDHPNVLAAFRHTRLASCIFRII